MAGAHARDSLLAVPESAVGFRGSFQAPMTIDAAAESKMNADLYKAAMLKMCLRDPTYLAAAQAANALNANGNGNGNGNGAAPKAPAGGWGYRILDDAEQAAFCERLTVEVFAPREEIVIQGQQHNQNFFIVTQGSVDLVVFHKTEHKTEHDAKAYKAGGAPCRTLLEQPAPESDTVKRTVLCSKKPGDFFGLHMLLGDPAVHSAIAGDNGVVCLKLTRANKDLFGKEYKATDTKLFSYFGKGFDRTISQLKFLRGLAADPRFLLFHVGFRLTTMDRDGVLFEPNKLEKDRGALQVLLEGAVNVLFRPIGQPIGTADKLIPVKKGQLFGEVGLGLWLPRNAGAIASSRCYFLELSQADFRKFCEIVPEALQLFQERLDEYKVPFDLWSESPMFVDRFVQLVAESKSAQNQQNYDFWRACRAFRISRVDDPKTVEREAQDLTQTYLSKSAAPNKKPSVKDATAAAVSAAVAKGANRLSLYPAEKEAVASLAPLWGKTPALAATCKRMLWEMFNDPISVAAPIKALNTGCNNPKCLAATTQLQQQLRQAEERAKAAQDAVDDAQDKVKELQALLALKK